MGACEAFRPTDRTRLNEMRAVKNSVCDTPKASNVKAERIEQASQKVEKRSEPRDHGSKEYRWKVYAK